MSIWTPQQIGRIVRVGRQPLVKKLAQSVIDKHTPLEQTVVPVILRRVEFDALCLLAIIGLDTAERVEAQVKRDEGGE